MKFIVLAVFSACVINANAQFRYADFKKLDNLIGRWEMKTGKGVLIEEWKKVNDSLLQNSSYRLEGRDSIQEETVLLKYSNGNISFTATTTQNLHSVNFPLLSLTNGKFIFENK